jgi:hypothetical protein
MQVERCGQCMHSGGRGKPTQDASHSAWKILLIKNAILVLLKLRKLAPVSATVFERRENY